MFVLPPLLGGIAIYLGYQVKKAGNGAGDMLMLGGAVATVAGMIFGAIVWTQVV